MKKSLLILGLGILFATPAVAELTVDDTVSVEYLKNHGHSKATINATQKIIAQSNGEASTEPVENEAYNNPVIKFVRRVFMYIDPSLDNHTFMNHDINTSTRYDDL